MSNRIVLVTGKNDQPIALKASTIEAIIGEEDGGCTIVTAHDTHRVTASYDETLADVWPLLTASESV